MRKRQTRRSSHTQSALPISPGKTTYQEGDKPTPRHSQPKIPSVLPSEKGVLRQITHVHRPSSAFRPCLEQDPANVSPEEAASGIIGIQVTVGVAMV